MVKYSFIILMAILFLGSGMSFANYEEKEQIEWEQCLLTEQTFHELRLYLNQKMMADDFLRQFAPIVTNAKFYGKIIPVSNQNKDCKKNNKEKCKNENKLHCYMQYYIRLRKPIIYTKPNNIYEFKIPVRDDLYVDDGTHPDSDYTSMAACPAFLGKIYYFRDYFGMENNVMIFEGAEKEVKIYSTIIKYIDQFREERKEQERY